MNPITICGCSDESVDTLIENLENKNEEEIKEIITTLNKIKTRYRKRITKYSV